MDDIYKNTDESSPNKKQKNINSIDVMIHDILSDKKLNY